MSRDFDEINPDDVESEPEGRFLRWMSALILLSALVGFFALAWYAYHTGTSTVETVQEETNVDLVKADNQPLKEAPSDPGGQQFPHQDKTVFNAIGGKEDEKVVENILPSSEEPLPRGGKTETWMNDKLYKKAHPESEQATAAINTSETSVQNEPAADKPVPTTPFDPSSVKKPAGTKVEPVAAAPLAPPEKPAAKPIAASAPTENPPVAEKEAPSQKVEPEKVAAKAVEKVSTPVSAVPVPSTPVVAPVVAKAEPIKAEEPVKSEAAVKKPATAKAVKVQLGAFKSEAEAAQQWSAISGKFSAQLADKQHQIVRVDLGAKGIFYRLHVSSFTSAPDAQSFCKTLSAKGQGCFVVGK